MGLGGPVLHFPPGHGVPELHRDADDGQDRLLRPGLVREDHQPAAHPRQDRTALPRRHGEPGDGGRPHALLRPAPARRGCDRRDEGAPAALHGPGPGFLQRHAAAGVEGRRRRRVRCRQPAARSRAERGVAVEPAPEPRGARPRAEERADRVPVQQAGPAQHPAGRQAAAVPEPRRGALLRGGCRPRRRRLRDAQGDLAPLARLGPREDRRTEEVRRRGRRAPRPGRRGRRRLQPASRPKPKSPSLPPRPRRLPTRESRRPTRRCSSRSRSSSPRRIPTRSRSARSRRTACSTSDRSSRSYARSRATRR